jgi:hypothetical protein
LYLAVLKSPVVSGDTVVFLAEDTTLETLKESSEPGSTVLSNETTRSRVSFPLTT